VTLGNLVIFGSGETAPAMVKVHREELSTFVGARGLILDTPYAFQANIDFMTSKLVEFFQVSLQHDFAVAHLRRRDAEDPVARGTFLAAVEAADYIFAGPGSPSYAVETWRTAGLGPTLTAQVARGRTVAFASAAALSLGTRTAPVYEIYKVGSDPFWLPGLDVLSLFGLHAVVIPHYDNAEGQNHDTRFCYLGDERLTQLEAMLENEETILGVDEHTVLRLNGEERTFRVQGRGGVTWRTSSGERVFPSGSEGSLDELAPGASERTGITLGADATTNDLDTLMRDVLNGGERAAVALAQLVDQARRGGGATLPADVLVPALLAARSEARSSGAYNVADGIRQALVDAGVEVMDGPAGATWRLGTPS
jgi:peptidase E